VKPVAQVAADFDRIARALADTTPRERLTAAERALLRQVPAGAKRAMDVGCGDGVITRALAMRGVNVLGVDVSRGMLDLARERTPPSLSVEYRLLDIMAGDLPIGMFRYRRVGRDGPSRRARAHHPATRVTRGARGKGPPPASWGR
jgi:ubiquinone/menaquinone biosynthesis C-methylase UbiE